MVSNNVNIRGSLMYHLGLPKESDGCDVPEMGGKEICAAKGRYICTFTSAFRVNYERHSQQLKQQ